MEKAVDNLESMFQKAEADLNYLTRKLDFQLENEEGLSSEENPVRMMKRVEEVKKECSAVAEDISAIYQAQQEATDYFRSQLVTLLQLTKKLEDQANFNPQVEEEAVSRVREFTQVLGIPLQSVEFPSSSQEHGLAEASGGAAVAGAASSSSLSSASSEPPAESSKTKNSECSGGDLPDAQPQSAFERRAASTEFIPVSEEEFLSVSDLVRGRAKLDDLNRTFKLLWQHFKEEGNTETLTPREMNNMGLRVTGATGEAKLKILRSLKLCQISKQGDVKLC